LLIILIYANEPVWKCPAPEFSLDHLNVANMSNIDKHMFVNTIDLTYRYRFSNERIERSHKLKIIFADDFRTFFVRTMFLFVVKTRRIIIISIETFFVDTTAATCTFSTATAWP
jgi:hypothetical protein